MSDPVSPQIYLITPPRFEIDTLSGHLARIMDAREIACLRMNLPATDESEARRAADRLREVCHARDVACVVTDHFRMVTPHGLDGVHLSDGPRLLRDARKAMGEELIAGCYCGASRHSGMIAGEAGADYVTFGPAGDDGITGTGETAPASLFEWWAQMIEVPLVAEGGLTPQLVAALAPHAEFFAVGPEIWGQDDPVAALETLIPT